MTAIPPPHNSPLPLGAAIVHPTKTHRRFSCFYQPVARQRPPVDAAAIAVGFIDNVHRLAADGLVQLARHANQRVAHGLEVEAANIGAAPLRQHLRRAWRDPARR